MKKNTFITKIDSNIIYLNLYNYIDLALEKILSFILYGIIIFIYNTTKFTSKIILMNFSILQLKRNRNRDHICNNLMFFRVKLK